MTVNTPPPIGTIGVANTGNSFVARAIRYCTGTEELYSGPQDAPVNHAFVYVGQVPGKKRPQLVEAEPHGASFADWDKYSEHAIWLTTMRQETGIPNRRPLLVPTAAQREAIRDFCIVAANSHVGYNYLDYIAITIGLRRFWGNRVAGEIQHWEDGEWWVKRLSNNGHEICSQLADDAWHHAGLDIFADERPSGLVTPEDLYIAGGAVGA